MPSSTRSALAAHRRRQKRRGLARVEVQVPRQDAELVRAVARELRDADGAALRAQLAALAQPPKSGQSILTMLACDLPDEAFDPMLERDRRTPRPVDL